MSPLSGLGKKKKRKENLGSSLKYYQEGTEHARLWACSNGGRFASTTAAATLPSVCRDITAQRKPRGRSMPRFCQLTPKQRRVRAAFTEWLTTSLQLCERPALHFICLDPRRLRAACGCYGVTAKREWFIPIALNVVCSKVAMQLDVTPKMFGPLIYGAVIVWREKKKKLEGILICRWCSVWLVLAPVTLDGISVATYHGS